MHRYHLSLLLVILVLVVSPAAADEGYGPLIANGLDEQLAIGADLFFNETFDGNGRTCSTCHLAADNYTLPAELSTVDPDSPLMVGDPQNPAHVPRLELCDATDCEAIRQNGLILVNPDGDFPGLSGARSYSMRSVPHVLSLATSIGPLDDRTGWSGDGAPFSGTLLEFATGAVRQHFTLDADVRDPGVDFRDPEPEELEAMAAFQLELGRRRDIHLTSVSFLDANAIDGLDIFLERCTSCHDDAGAHLGVENLNRNTGIEELRMDACVDTTGTPGQCAEASNELVAGANHDGGFGTADLSETDGRWGDGEFNTPPLIEAADTAPFFHDNSEEKLEAAIEFYRSEFFLNSPSCPTPPTPPETGDCGLAGTDLPEAEVQIGATLRILNAGLNVAMTAQRLNSAIELLATETGTDPTVIKTLELAREELADALASISATKFANSAIFVNTGDHIKDARTELDDALDILDSLIANGASGLQIATVAAYLINTSETHLSDSFYDETDATCLIRGFSVDPDQYHDCRWIYDLGSANVIFDNAGVTPSIVDGQTRLTWTPNPGGTATLTMTWRTDEWTNPVLSETVLKDISPNPSFDPVTFKGSATRLPNGQFEQAFSHTIPCVPKKKYEMTVEARVGGVTEIDSAIAKAARFCVGF